MMKYMGCKHLQLLPIVALTLLIINSCGDMVADEDNPEDLLQQYGHEYHVWAKNAGSWSVCVDPTSDGYTWVGSSSHTQNFNFVSPNSWLIVTEPRNFAFVDAVEDGVSIFQSFNNICNTSNPGAVNGLPPDGDFAWVGTEHARGQRGFMEISSFNNNLIVHINGGAYYFDD